MPKLQVIMAKNQYHDNVLKIIEFLLRKWPPTHIIVFQTTSNKHINQYLLIPAYEMI
jgi:hypothetical protein